MAWRKPRAGGKASRIYGLIGENMAIKIPKGTFSVAVISRREIDKASDVIKRLGFGSHTLMVDNPDPLFKSVYLANDQAAHCQDIRQALVDSGIEIR